MFHAHKTEFAEKGWTGLFLVNDIQSINPNSNITPIGNITTYTGSESDNATNLTLTGGLQ
jgi:hypothetical protein